MAKYTCPMHPEVISNEPGVCPKCNMNLVSDDTEDETNGDHDHSNPSATAHGSVYACPMHPDVTSDKPGMCPKCHMALEKTKRSSHDQHDHHDKHAGHNPNMFKQKFWLSLLLTIPTLIFSPMVQSWFGVHLAFAGSEYIPAVFGIIIFFYGGLVFLKEIWGHNALNRIASVGGYSLTHSLYHPLVSAEVCEGQEECSILYCGALQGRQPGLAMGVVGKVDEGFLNSQGVLGVQATHQVGG